jgi:hypothetical protein
MNTELQSSFATSEVNQQEAMLDFITQVELAQRIVEINANITRLGHFSYRDFTHELTAV